MIDRVLGVKRVSRVVVFAVLLLASVRVGAQPAPQVHGVTVQPSSPDEGEVVTFIVDAEHPDDAPLRFSWTFGDGTRLAPSPRSARVATVYVDEGTFEARVVVEDPAGATASAHASVSVANVPPRILAIDSVSDATRGRAIRFSARVHDPGDDPVRFAWDFGDGTATEPSTDAAQVAHAYEEPGRYSVRLVVDDGDGGRDERTLSVDVGPGLRYDLAGTLDRSSIASRSAFYAAAPIVHRERGDAIFGEDPICTVHFGGGDTAASGRSATEPIVSFQGAFPDGLLEGTSYAVMSERNETGVVPPGESIRRLYRAPDHFYVAVFGEGPGGRDAFHGTGGHVQVERADARRVELSFDVALERTLNDTEILETGQEHPPGEPLALRGRLVLDLEADSASRSPSVFARNGAYHLCRPAEAMRVVEVGPVDGPPMPASRDGVVPLIDYDAPALRVRFSHPVDMDRARESMGLAWRHRDGALREVPVEVTAETPESVVVTPLVPLMDGVVHRLTIRGGGNGVLGADGRILAEDEVRHAETVLDLSEARNGIGISVTQVSRDAPLVPDKPAEIRVYVNWTEKPHVDPAWQTRWAEFDVDVAGAHEDDVRTSLRRWDLYGAEELKHARDAVRLFGWRPESGTRAELTVGVTQAGPGEPGRRFETSWQGRVLAPVSPMTIEYAFVRAGSWREGVPPDVRARGAQIAYSGAMYSEQVFPVPGVRVRSGPDVTVAPPVGPTVEYGGYAWTIGWLYHQQTRESVVAREFVAGRGGDPNGPDVALLFVPADVLGTSGQAQTSLGTDPRVVLVSVTADSPVDARSNTVAHEVGHAYGLDHGSDCETRDPSVLQSCIDADHRDVVEGTRVAIDGRSGANKSVWSGNADLERTPGYLFSLMHPMAVPDRGTFITRDDYATLLGTMAGAARTSPRSPAFAAATSGPVRVQATRAPGLRVDGWIDVETGDARIGRVRPSIEPAASAPPGPEPLDGDGPWLQALGQDGRLLGRVAIEPRPGEPWHPASDVSTWRPFSAFVPRPGDAEAGRVQVVSDARLLDERRASPSPPTVAFDVDAIDLDGAPVARWSATDADGDVLRFDLAYAPDGVDWRPVAIDLEASSLALHAASLPMGDDPRLRITARDGVHAAVATVAVRGDGRARVAAVWPHQDAIVSPATSITVWTSGRATDPAPGVLRLETRDVPGEPVEGTLQLLPDGDGLRFLPARPLDADTHYAVALGPNLATPIATQADAATRWTFSTHDVPVPPDPPDRDLRVPDSGGPGDEPDSRPRAPAVSADRPTESEEAAGPRLCGGLGIDTWGVLVAGGDPARARIEPSDEGCRIEYASDGSFLNLQSFLFATPFYFLVERPADEEGAITFTVQSEPGRLEGSFTATFELLEGPPHLVTVHVRAE